MKDRCSSHDGNDAIKALARLCSVKALIRLSKGFDNASIKDGCSSQDGNASTKARLSR
jgi:hypothetical protein